MTSKRAALAIETKKELIEFHLKNPDKSHEYLACHFSSLVGHKVDRSTVSRILREKDEILNFQSTWKKKRRLPKHLHLEKLLFQWITTVNKKTAISNALVQAKAMELGQKLGIKDFKYSRG